MKTESKIILVSVLLGAFVSTAHYVLDLLLLQTPSVEAPALHAKHELIINLSILLFFTAIGCLCSYLIAKQKQTEQKLTESLHFQEQILETLPIPVFYKDEEAVYQGCNNSFANLLGLNKQEIIGKTVHDISPQDLAKIYHEKDMELINNPGVQRYEFEVKSKLPEANRQVIFHKATFRKADGRVGGDNRGAIGYHGK